MRLASTIALCATGLVSAQTPTPAPTAAVEATPLERYLASTDEPAPRYRARRVLTARAGSSRQASLVAMTTVNAAGEFSYEILSEEGSGTIRSKVLHAALEAEQKARSRAQSARAAVTAANYTFEPAGAAGDGCERIRIKPRRNEAMMIDGSIIVQSEDGELRTIAGTLVKRPSFWTRRVEIERTYARIAGVRVPVAMSSVADVLFVGRSTFDMRYEYESINGVTVPRAAGKGF